MEDKIKKYIDLLRKKEYIAKKIKELKKDVIVPWKKQRFVVTDVEIKTKETKKINNKMSINQDSDNDDLDVVEYTPKQIRESKSVDKDVIDDVPNKKRPSEDKNVLKKTYPNPTDSFKDKNKGKNIQKIWDELTLKQRSAYWVQQNIKNKKLQ
jgi:hypothetical protein